MKKIYDLRAWEILEIPWFDMEWPNSSLGMDWTSSKLPLYVFFVVAFVDQIFLVLLIPCSKNIHSWAVLCNSNSTTFGDSFCYMFRMSTCQIQIDVIIRGLRIKLIIVWIKPSTSLRNFSIVGRVLGSTTEHLAAIWAQ